MPPEPKLWRVSAEGFEVVGHVCGLVGPEIICSPIQHARAKLPESLLDPSRVVDDEAADRLRAMIGENVAPWHQDAQVHLEVADPHPIVTVWIPLVDAT
ncbi:MAG: hypothetical protein VCF24_23650, partial [Candidatus Latescibacterota bacterium]